MTDAKRNIFTLLTYLGKSLNRKRVKGRGSATCNMEFGKLPDIARVDFDMPPDFQGNVLVLDGLPVANTWPLYIGATGWAMKPWLGSYYPSGTSPKAFLSAYTAQFNTIELNTTHYRIPDLETVLRWAAQSPEDFRFCPKIPQTISHSRDLGIHSGQIGAFSAAIAHLDGRLGPCFLQLPPHFGPDQLPILEAFLQKWPVTLPLAVEFRHPEWFDRPDPLGDAGDLLAAHGTGAVITDVAGRRDVMHMRLTAPFVLIRFVGNSLHPSDFSRIRAWVGRLHEWFEMGLQSAFFFCHEPDNIQAPELAAFLGNTLLEYHSPWVFRTPKKITAEPSNGQMRLFK
jgi:uncharacterized protein YecE (DUF72 family)